MNDGFKLLSKLHKRQREGMVTSTFEAVNYLIETYTINDVVAKYDADMMHCTSVPNRPTKEYAKVQWNRVVWCNTAYGE